MEILVEITAKNAYFCYFCFAGLRPPRTPRGLAAPDPAKGCFNMTTAP